MKKNHDRNLKLNKFERGDPIWLYNSRKASGSKLCCLWERPYVVLDRINDAIYRVKKGPKATYEGGDRPE